MLFTCDPTGYPLLFVPDPALSVHLLPVTRHQFASCPESKSFDGPDCGEGPESRFATGLLPQEVETFSAWLGPEFRVPTVEEWRALYLALALGDRTSSEVTNWLESGGAGDLCSAARALLDELLTQRAPCSLFHLMQWDDCLVEWVRRGDDWVGLGRPRPEFQPNLWNPLEDEVEPVSLESRVRYFGCRLVRRGPGQPQA